METILKKPVEFSFDKVELEFFDKPKTSLSNLKKFYLEKVSKCDPDELIAQHQNTVFNAQNLLETSEWSVPHENLRVSVNVLRDYCLMTFNKSNRSKWENLLHILFPSEACTKNASYLLHCCVKLWLSEDDFSIRNNVLNNILLGKQPQELIILLLIALCKKLQYNLYTYEFNVSEEIPIISEYIIIKENDPDQVPYLFVGMVNGHVFPFVKHSLSTSCHPSGLCNARVVDTNQFPFQKICKYSFLRHMDLKMMTKLTLTSSLNEVNFVRRFERTFRIVPTYKINDVKDYMNLAKFTEVYADALQTYGCVKLSPESDQMRRYMMYRAADMTDEMKIDFQNQYLYRLTQGGFYVLFQRSSKPKTLPEARSAACQNLKKLRGDKHAESFQDNVNLSTQNFALPDQQYMYAYYEATCPLIEDWKFGNKFVASNNLDVLHQKFPGIKVPFYYLTVGDSFFGVHCESQNLYSANFLLEGRYKKWLVIPRRFYHDFQNWVKDELKKEQLEMKCTAFLNHKTLYIDPSRIPQRFEVTYVCQEENDLVIVDTKAIHWGFNDGPNLSLGFNFIAKNWINHYHEQMLCNPVELTSTADSEPMEEDLNESDNEEASVNYPESMQQLLDDALCSKTCNFGIDPLDVLEWLRVADSFYVGTSQFTSKDETGLPTASLFDDSLMKTNTDNSIEWLSYPFEYL